MRASESQTVKAVSKRAKKRSIELSIFKALSRVHRQQEEDGGKKMIFNGPETSDEFETGRKTVNRKF